MSFQKLAPLKMNDPINDYIWDRLHKNNYEALNILDSKSFSIEHITKELESGCSPCPDIVTSKFGDEPSVMFVSTVYGLVNKYVKQEYDRDLDHWTSFCDDFNKRIIQSGIGIYSRLDKVYKMLSDLNGHDLEVCFTELVKTVLVDRKNSVSGLGSKGTFIKYFESVEYTLLKERLSQINNKCFIFSFSEEVTYYILKIFAELNNTHQYYDVSDILKVPKADGIACPRLVDYNVRI